MSKRLIFVLLIIAVVGAGGYLLADWYSAKPLDTEARYIGRESCVQCHQKEAALFHGSDHDLAMGIATEASVLGDFNNATLEHFGIESRMYRDGQRFMVHTEGPDGEMADFEVKWVFGVRPLQQYMVEIERPADAKPDEIGRVQVLRISWDTTAKKWFFLMPPDVDEKLDPTDPLHWTGITQNWNTSCAYCHSTNLKKNFNALTGKYRTTFSEINVSCEACHGPGSLHVELATAKSFFWDRNHHYGLVNLKTSSNIPQVETCAPCHSRRSMIAEDFRPGCNFDDYFATQLLTQPIYHADGQVRDENYVYGSFTQSKMFHNGIRCTDCHDPHSTKVKHQGNLLCTSCHQHPAGKYDSPSHHHHQPGTPGASCVACHMPETTYMMVDARRDHSLRVPRPDLSVRFGTPNACTGCHLDEKKIPANPDRKPLTQYLDWIIAAENGDANIKLELERVNQSMLAATEKWYPENSNETHSDYYDRLTAGLAQSNLDVPILTALAQDQKVPAIIRATAIQEMANDLGEESRQTALAALADSNPKVVAAAMSRIEFEFGNLLSRSGDRETAEVNRNLMADLVTAVAEMFDHSSRRVRIESARVFVSLPPEIRNWLTDTKQAKKFELALDEYKKSLYVENDRAIYHMMLGGLYEMLGDSARAKEAYRAAISVEPNLAGPRANLAALLESEIAAMSNTMRGSQSGGQIQAGELQALMPKMKSLNEEVQQLRKREHELLAIDVRRAKDLPGTHGLHYRFAMSSYVQDDLEATKTHLLEAHRQEPNTATYLLGLATYYLHVKEPREAMKYIQSLLKLDGENLSYRALADQAQRELADPNSTHKQ